MTKKQRKILLALGEDLKTAIEEQANGFAAVRAALKLLEVNWQRALTHESKLAMCLTAEAYRLDACPTVNLPTADEMPTDTERFNWFEAKRTEGCLWVCRRAVYASGWYMQEVTPAEVEYFGWDAYTTVREAIAAAMEKEKKDD